MKKRILCDMDGVITCFNRRVVEHLRALGHETAAYADLVRFNYEVEEVWGPLWGRIAFDRIDRDDIYDGLEPEPGALYHLDSLRRDYEVVIVTSPLVNHAYGKLKWLMRHGFKHRDVVLASRKELVQGDLLIDDAVKNIKAWPGAALVFDRPWNQEGLPLMHRAYDWADAERLARHILENRS